MPILGEAVAVKEWRERLRELPRPWVVDVGSGADPFPLANVLVDKHIEDWDHRWGLIRTDGKLLIEADVQDLPFDDEELDFAWCSHVLEHTENPKRALDELQRVAPRGIAFVPTPWSEAVYQECAPGQSTTHKWAMWSGGNKLFCLYCDTADKQLTKEVLTLLEVWPAPNPRRAARTETRIAWGWGAWPRRMEVELLELDPKKKDELRAILAEREREDGSGGT